MLAKRLPSKSIRMKDRTGTWKIRWGEMEIGGPTHWYRERLLVAMLRDRVKGGRILDAGCGDGSLTLRLWRAGYSVDAVDLSDDFVSSLKDRMVPLDAADAVRVRKGDVTSLDFPDEIFDAVVSGEVLEHVDDDCSAVREYHRVLKVGGICVVSVPFNPRRWDFTDEWAGHLRRYSKARLLRLFEGSGFCVERIQSWGFPVMYIYYHLIYLPWARGVINKSVEERRSCFATKIGLNRYVSMVVGKIFEIDNIFGGFPWGIGVVLRARKI